MGEEKEMGTRGKEDDEQSAIGVHGQLFGAWKRVENLRQQSEVLEAIDFPLA